MSKRIHPCALAVTFDGTTLLNVANLHVEQQPEAILRRALAEGGRLFIGIQLNPRDAQETRQWLDNGAHEAAGHVGGRLQRRRGKERRKRARSS